MKRFNRWLLISLIGACEFCVCALVLPCNAASQHPLLKGVIVEKIATGFQFTEGPCWRKAGYLVFSDVQGSTVYKWTEQNGATVLIQPSGKSNGLAEDAEGRLLLAQHEKRQLARIETNGAETALVTRYNNKRLNSPNDLAVAKDGSIYFTDPPYGINSSQEELGFYGVFRYIPASNTLQLLIDSLQKPNGIMFSPDGSKLYIGDTDKKRIIVCDVRNDGSLANHRVLINLGGERYVDGLKVDGNGCIYSAGTLGYIWVISPEGVILDSIAVPEQTRNLAWGGTDGKSLFITSGNSVYRAVMTTAQNIGLIARPVIGHAKVSCLQNNAVLVRYPYFSVSGNLYRASIDIFDGKGVKLVNALPALESSYSGRYLQFNIAPSTGKAFFYRITCQASCGTKQVYGKCAFGK